jgi:hypothetical protein
MTDWELIKSTSGEYVNPWIRYAWQRSNVEYAICHKGWRQNTPMAPRTSALLQFYARQMDELWAKYGEIWIYGALLDYAMAHREYDIWYNGEQL